MGLKGKPDMTPSKNLDEALARFKETIRQQLLAQIAAAKEAIYQAEYDDYAYTNGTMAAARKMLAEAEQALREHEA